MNKTIQVVILGVLLSPVLRVVLRVILGLVLGVIIGVVLGMVLRKVIRKVLGVVQWLVWGLVLWMLGKPQHKNIAVHLGIAQIAIGPPPPRTQTGTLWHLFSGKIMQMPVCTFLKIGATNHPGKGLGPPPPKRAMPK